MAYKDENERWDKLLSCRRLNDIKNGRDVKCDINDPRNPFQRDCDRITYSYPFRRLQDKTQVIPLPVIDFVHTRLTHTLEVATVGRSLGKLLENYLINELSLDKKLIGSIPAVVAAACLAHDIGNPPFGHSGEDSISEFFNFGIGKYFLENEYRAKVETQDDIYYEYSDVESECKMRDLQYFEGNAMGFHLLTSYEDGTLNLTCATLAAFSKYPRQSFIEDEIPAYEDNKRKIWNPNRVSQKKYGFFQTELEDFKIVAQEVGLKPLTDFSTGNYAWARHPLSFLMEAADDICYRIIDLEDGFRTGRISFVDASKPLMTIALKGGLDVDAYNKIPEKNEKRKFSYLRARSINALISGVFDVFKRNYYDIVDFEFDHDLINQIADQDILNALDSIKALIKGKVYKCKDVLLIEAKGFEVLGSLVSSYIDASNICHECPQNTRSKKHSKIFDLLPEEYQHVDADEVYNRYLKIAAYVSGMTDSFAIDLYQRIKGINPK